MADRDPDAEMESLRLRLDASDELLRLMISEGNRVAKARNVGLSDLLRDTGMRMMSLGASELQRRARGDDP
jgi:hypothetical protein